MCGLGPGQRTRSFTYSACKHVFVSGSTTYYMSEWVIVSVIGA